MPQKVVNGHGFRLTATLQRHVPCCWMVLVVASPADSRVCPMAASLDGSRALATAAVAGNGDVLVERAETRRRMET